VTESSLYYDYQMFIFVLRRGQLFNPINAELNPICHLLALLRARHIHHVSRVRVKNYAKRINMLSGRDKILNFKPILVAGLLARSQYLGGPAILRLDTGSSWFPCVYKQMLRWFPRLQVATACFSCSPPDLNSLDPYFIFMLSLFHIYVHA